MKPVIIINTFKTILFNENKKPIVICDIDHTFLRPQRNYSDIYNQIKPDFSDIRELDKFAKQMYDACINVGLVKQTDNEGFIQMLERIKQLGGKFLFLTARSSLAHDKTIKDFIKCGLENPEQYEIHYTGNEITKGHYIKKNNLLHGYDHHIFIDDFPHFLESALQIYPNMDCYLFKY